MTAQPLLQFGTVALDPAPDGRVVRFQAALAEQFFDIAERERVPKVPAHGAQNQLGLGLSPLEDRRSDCLLHDRFRLSATVGHSCNTTSTSPSGSTGRTIASNPSRPRSLTVSRTAACSVASVTIRRGVVARIVPGPHDAHRQDPHRPMRYDTGRPRAVIRLRISQPRTTSLPCLAGLRARRPSPMMDLYRKNVFSTRL